MPATKHTEWQGSLHQTFRLLPTHSQSPSLSPFLESDGLHRDDVLSKLPYDRKRAIARGADGTSPSPKRYRDGRQLYMTAGLVYEDESKKLRVTELGHATRRWLDVINDNNCVILARHAAYALASCQLRNPTGAGNRYDESMVVFPFVFIWKAMLELDYRINSEELNRCLFKVANEDELEHAIESIRIARMMDEPESLGEEVITGRSKNDRIIPWMALASFGWTIFPDKRGGELGYYELSPRTLRIVKEAARMKRKHREFESQAEYAEFVSRKAALPKDLR